MVDISSKNELDWIYEGGNLNMDEVKIYKEQGVLQETAVFEATGTGVFTSFNIGYRFRKHNISNR